MKRREFLGLGALLGLGSLAKAQEVLAPTPPEVKGPFYPVIAQADRDFDLTQVEGRKQKAKGRTVVIYGSVLDTNGRAIDNASVEIWQANSAGRYRHPSDTSDAPLDENFQGWAIVPSGKNGAFRFRTIIPGAYQASSNWTRPPHIHFKVSKRGYQEVITQMHFPGEPLNDEDLLLQRKTAAERRQMIAREVDHKEYKVLMYDIVLARIA